MVNKFNTTKISFCAAFAALTAVSAQIRFSIGLIPYTMQNFIVILSGLLLGPMCGMMAQLTYLSLIFFGLPLASGFKGGLGVLLGPTGGYLFGFPISSLLAGLFRQLWEKISKNLLFLWILVNLASLPIYILGYTQLLMYGANPNLLIVAVLVFVPQDFLMDHVLAIFAYKYIKEFLDQRGIVFD